MAGRSFDYSKWDNIELSDDESDLHPNIDKQSWFRMKHRTRLEREEREDQEILDMKTKTEEDQARINIIQAHIKAANTVSAEGDEENDAQYEDMDALQIELKELTDQIAQRNKRVAEIREKRQWNIDNICKVKEEKTIVNDLKPKSLKADASESFAASDDLKVEDITDSQSPSTSTAVASSSSSSAGKTANSSSSVPSSSSASDATAAVAAPSAPSPAQVSKGAEPAAAIKRERMAVISYNDFAIKHERVLERYSEIEDMEAAKEFLFKNCDILLHEHAQSYMLLSCLEDEMNGKHKRMKLVCRQSQILSHIQELGTSMKRDPRDVILPFFKRISDPEYFKGFVSAVEDFTKKIQKRAVEKRKEMDAERDAEEEIDEANAPLGPGGLNPITVLKNMPKKLRDAFESQDMDRLQSVLGRMDAVEAKYWMKQCVDAGLWVANDPSIFEDGGKAPRGGGGGAGGGSGARPATTDVPSSSSAASSAAAESETAVGDDDQPPPLEA